MKSGSPEHRERMRQIAIERGFGKWMTGKKLSKETRIKMSLQRQGRLHPMFGKKHKQESKDKMSDAHIGISTWNKGMKGFLQGEEHWHWQPDRTKIKGKHERSFHDPEYKQWHRAVKDRDGWKCRIDNETCSGRTEAHHILSWRDYPELRYQVNNGITLCHAHHPRKRIDEQRMSEEFQRLVLETSTNTA